MSFALNIQTADDLAADALEARGALVKAECSSRIFEVADSIAQMNMAAAAPAGRLSAGQMTTWQSALQWVDDMRAACLPLIADAGADYAADAAWPDVPSGVADLAAAF